MDFVEALPRLGGWDTLLVVVDRLSKYAYLVGLKHPFTTFSVAAAFIKEIVRLHDFLASIISDRDKVFKSHFWKELLRLQRNSLLHNTAYHSQTDGQTEIVNQALEGYLRCFINGQPKSWNKWLHWTEFCYNTSPHLSLNVSPFQVLYGRPPPTVVRLGHNTTSMDSIEQLLHERRALLDELSTQLLVAQNRMRQAANSKRIHEVFEVGNIILSSNHIANSRLLDTL